MIFSSPTMRNNKATVYIAAVATFALFLIFLHLPGGPSSSPFSVTPYSTAKSPADSSSSNDNVIPGADSLKVLVEGGLGSGVIMPKLDNATIKAELGRASWKLFHTMLARFPEKPNKDERDALSQYIHLFARLYPCGDCASHFRKILDKFPPQTSSREAASQWGCHVHNQVNERLKKELFDCNSIADKYKCGCAEDEEKEKAEKEKAEKAKEEGKDEKDGLVKKEEVEG